MLNKINLIKERIQERSNGSRTAYLKNIEFWKQNSPNRNSLGCSNLAHTYAACNKKTSAESLNIKKFIGIITAYNDMLSAHAPLEAYPGQLKNQADKLNLHIQVAGGVPAMCDGITQGEPGMELSLFSRDAIALSTAIGLSHNVFDAAICMGTCDKIVPGLLIGALKFGHLPVIFIPGGPMATGISNAKKSETRQSYAAGEIEKIDLLAIEQQAYHSEGTCTFYGTANTNQLIAEAMGFQL
ncbi:MAG: dihydroxy-acid dehydratase domain-containing protein, partial [Gammaproteobacteria bacterium]